ncbi:unnamed protein product, partial [Prorocentrum cordatum]
MVYEQANWERKSPGSIDICRIVAKLEAKYGAGPRGEFFDGTNAAASTRGEEIARGGIGRRRPTARKAKPVLDDIDVSKPFQTRTGVVRCIEAVARVHHREMKTLPSGKTRLQMLKCAAQPEMLEWMLNAARIRTTSNESFHMELKRCFFGQSMHPCMLALKLAVIHTAKLMAHNSALCRKTLAQVPQSRLLHRLVGAMELFSLA